LFGKIQFKNMTDKIKILHIITRLDKGGSAENTVTTCLNLDKNKYETKLVFGACEAAAPELSGIQHICVNALKREISPLQDLRAFFELYKIISREKPDIVHTHSSKAGVLGRWAALLAKKTRHPGIKIIHTPHGHVFYGYSGSFKNFLFVLIEKFSAIACDRLVALTEGERRESLGFGIGRAEKWSVIHSGVEEKPAPAKERKTIDGIPENHLVAGTVARLEPVKGVRYFIESIPEIIKSAGIPVFFVIVGDGTLRKELESLAASLEINHRVLFAGMKDNVSDYMSAMDIYIQPSVNEGMGKTIVQAMSLWKPVVASNVQGIPDLVINNITGLLVPPKNPEAIAHAVTKLIRDPQLQKNLGERGSAFVNETIDGFPRFSTGRMLFLLDKLYSKVLNR